MREFHVIFMYKGLALFMKFEDAMEDGPQIITAYKNLLLALHLTKGFSSEVNLLYKFDIKRPLMCWTTLTFLVLIYKRGKNHDFKDRDSQF